MNYRKRLHRLAISETGITDSRVDHLEVEAGQLDPKTLEFVRLAALVAVGGIEPSYGVHADAALSAGATVDEIVDVLFAVLPVVGLPLVVAAAPELAMALGYDIEAED